MSSLTSSLTSSFARTTTTATLVLSLLAAGVAFGLSLRAERTWSSSTEIAPQLSLLDGGNGTNVFSLNIDGAKRFVDAQVALINGREVLGPVEQAAGMSAEEFDEHLDVEPGESGATVVITVRHPDSAQAPRFARGVVEAYRTVRTQQLRSLARSRYEVIARQLGEQRLLGLGSSELALQLQRDLAQVLVPLEAGPESVLTVVSSPSRPERTPRRSLLQALIAFVATAGLVTAVLLALRALSDRVIDPADLRDVEGGTPLGLLSRRDGPDVAAAHAAALLALPAVPASRIVVLSASAEALDEEVAQALADGLVTSGRPAQAVASPDAEGSPDVLPVAAGGWATQLPERLAALDPGTALCLAVRQGTPFAEVRASLASIRQVSALPVGLLLLPGRTLP